MGALAVRNLWERKLRAALTSLAIVLGVMMVAGTYVLTDTIDRSFERIFTESNQGVDAVVNRAEAIDSEEVQPPPFSARVLDRVPHVDGVGAAAGGITDPQVSIVGADGETLGGTGAPSFGFSVLPERFDPLTYVEGRRPAADDEVVIDRASADDEGFEVGDQVRIAGKEAARSYTLVGIATLGEVDSFGGATLAELALPEAQRVTGKEGQLDQISVAAEEGTSPEQLAANLTAALPKSLKAETGAENVETQREDVGEFIGFLKTALLIFAGVALFVAAFLIFNTFSITVAQRTREFAMLRALGASRRQILVSVVIEALVVGFAAAAVGVLAGIGIAPAIRSLLDALGVDLPSTGSVIESRTVIVGLALGTALTVLAALAPALRATRVAPVTGLREGAVPPTVRERRARALAGAVLSVLGIVLMLLGVFEAISPAEAWVGAGAAALLLGTALLSPRLVTPLAAFVGVPLERLRGIPGRIARENAIRNPGRTAATAAALMIGLALVTFVAVFAAGIRGSIDSAIDKTIASDLIVSNQDGFSDIPVASVDAAASIDGVEVASPLRYTEDEVRGAGDGFVTLVDPATAADVLTLDWQDGSQDLLAELAPDEAVVDESWAADKGIGVDDTFEAKTASGRTLTYKVTGTFTDNADFIGDYAASNASAAAFGEARSITNVLLDVSDEADVGAVSEQIDTLLAERFPVAKVEDRQGLKDSIGEQLDALVGVVYALLFLSVLVSLFGIVNTLALSIHERTRELGLLRALGASRRQVRRIVRYEAVITALIGAALGAVLGVLFAVLASRPLADEGFTLEIPVGTLLALLVLAAIAGVLAAIGPARRASRHDVLEALAYE